MTNVEQDRRRCRRHQSTAEHAIVAARVRPGRDVSVIDVSASGALIESRHQLLPGSVVELQLETPQRRTAVRGRVLRCAIARLGAASVCYRGAICFERQLSWLAGDGTSGYPLHCVETRGAATIGARATRLLSDAATGAPVL